MTSHPSPSSSARTMLGDLGAYLREIGLEEMRLRERLGALSSRTVPDEVAVARRRLGDDELAAATRFWYLGIAATETEARAALGPTDAGRATSAGLVERRQGALVPLVRITPVDGLLIAHDHDRGGPLHHDHVLGIGAATRTLASLTPRDPVSRTLDLGTGNGVQALSAAAHSEAVIATDVNERAVWFTRVNAALDDQPHVDVRAGDAFDPLGDERFDLIVANPPFVISPDHVLAFRDAPSGGESVSRSIVRGAASRLRAGGTACVLVNWMVRDRSAEIAAPASWVADLDCDSLILHHDTLDPISYAQRWMLPGASGSAAGGTLDRWLGHYGDAGAIGIASGAVILRKTGASARVRIARMRRPRDGGDHVGRILAAIGRFDGPDDPRLPDARFALVEPHELEQRLSFEDGAYRAGDARLRLRRTAGVEASLPADLQEVLFLIDGQRRLGDALVEVADARGEPPDALRERALPRFLELFERGYLSTESTRSSSWPRRVSRLHR